MKKFDKALSEIKQGVYDAMFDAVSCDDRTCHFEYDFGNTTIMIEIEVIIGGCCVVVDDVWVERENEQHNSPKVIAAVKNILPCWYDVVRDVEEQIWNEREEEKFLRAQACW
jgi:hypothetical protein